MDTPAQVPPINQAPPPINQAPPVSPTQSITEKLDSYLPMKWIKRIGIIIVVLIVITVIYSFISFAGIYSTGNYLRGVVINAESRESLRNVKVDIKNKGLGITPPFFNNEYNYSAITDGLGLFKIRYNVGRGAHVVIEANGYERFEEDFNRNDSVTIELKPTR